MKTKPFIVASVTVLSLAAAVGITKATGYWRTESSKVPTTFTGGEFAGQSDPGDIKGSYSFNDIEKNFGVPPELLASAFGMESADPGTLQAKSLETAWSDLEGGVEVGTDSVRLFTALWAGLPFTPEETTVLPFRAVEVLEENGKIDEKLSAELRLRAVLPSGGAPGTGTIAESSAEVGSGSDAQAVSTVPAVPAPSGAADVSANQSSTTAPETAAAPVHEAPERQVKGLTTFGELEKWGVTGAMWETRLGKPMGSRGSSLKDWAAENGLSMSEIRDAAQEMVDSAA
jgi:hypothetical protein